MFIDDSGQWPQVVIGAIVGGAVFATTGSVKAASTLGGVAGGAVGGFVGTVANGGSVGDAFANAAKGAITGAVGGFVGGSIGGAFASPIAGAIAGSVAGGSAGQFTGALLNGAGLGDALLAAIDPRQAVINGITGLAGYASYKAIGVPLETYLEVKSAQVKQKVVEYNCGSAEKIKAQDTVDDVTPDVPDIVENNKIITDGSHLENGKLKPNVTYKAGEYNYIYKTNVDGLIVSASADDLQFKTHEN